MQVFKYELPLQKKDASVHAAEMLIITEKIVGLLAAETVETASILQGHLNLTGILRNHMDDSQSQLTSLQIDLHHFQEEAAHFDQRAFS